jgi:serine/threonine protein kinase
MILGWFGGKRDRLGEAGKFPDDSKQRKYRVGDTIAGAYRVLHVFEGGLGVVYLVEHTTGDRIVLKTIKRASSQTGEFKQEAATWVRLGRHPHIVEAHWVDEIAGLLCVAAELIEPDEIGRVSLRDYLRFGALTPTQIARYAAHFCYGLEHALSRGLVCHRDVKPENLLIGASGNLKITDFGIATAAAPAAEAQQARLGRWQAGGLSVAGTPPYMAPEQIAGSAAQDHRTDIYSFGVVLYEMTYGKLPFSARSASEFFQHHLKTEPKVPHGPFADIVRRCLEKSPSMRYAQVSDLLVDFERACKARKLFLPPRPVPEDNSVAELRVRARSLGALGRLAEAIASARELLRRAPEDSSAWTQLGRLLLESGDVDSAKDATNRSLALDPTRSAPWNNLGLMLERKEKWRDAVEAFDRALDCDPQNTGAMLNAAEPLRRIGKVGEAVRRLRRASEIAPDKFSIWTNLGSVYMNWMRDRACALECLHKARALAPASHRAKIEDLIHDAEKLPAGTSAEALLAHGRTADAKTLLRQAVEQRPGDRDAWHNLGICHLDSKEYVQARACFLEVYRVDESDGFAVCRLIELAALASDLEDAEHWCDVLSALPDGTVAAIAFRARALNSCGRAQNARRVLNEGLVAYPEEADLLIAFGDIASTHNHYKAAAESYERAVAALRKGPHHISRLREIESRLRMVRQELSKSR